MSASKPTGFVSFSNAQIIERTFDISKQNYFKTLQEKIRRIDFNELHTKIHFYQREIADFIKQRRTVKLLHLFRHYSAFAVVLSSAFLVSATNVAAGKGTNGFLFGYWDDNNDAPVAGTNKINGQNNKKNDLALVPLAKSNTAVDLEYKEDDTQTFIQGQGAVAIAQAGNNAMRDPEEDGGVKMYTVAEGDTLSSIAAKNKVSVNTILWANDISNVDSIMPGDTLFILPVSGVQYVFKKGDSLDSIATKYKASKEKIIAFNDLPANGDVEEGKTIVIPDGQGESAAPQPQTQTTPSTGGLQRRQYATEAGGAPEISSGLKDRGDDTGKEGDGHRFPYGWCTWYVAQKRYVPWGGNAGTWLYHAKAQGYRTGRAPAAGSIMVSTENRYYGHVAYVEKVNGDTITISEMNYVGWGKVSRRTISASSRAIKGFIY